MCVVQAGEQYLWEQEDKMTEREIIRSLIDMDDDEKMYRDEIWKTINDELKYGR